MIDVKWVWYYGRLPLCSFWSLYHRSIGCAWCENGCNGHTVVCQSVSRALSSHEHTGSC